MSEQYHRTKGLSSALSYVDPKSAFQFLETAFGFEPLLIILDENEQIAHSEMTYGDSIVMVGGEWSENHSSPKNMGGKNTQTVHVQLAKGDDIDAHCEHARKSGAEILAEPETQFYGDRTYRARDPEGHIWTFGVNVEAKTSDEWDAAAGGSLRTVASL